MAIARKIDELLEGSYSLERYDLNNLSLGGVGSHSMLEIGEGTLAQRMRNFALAKKGREKPYTKTFRERRQGSRTVGCIQEVYVVDNWKEITTPEVVSWIRKRNGVVVPSRSWAVYLRDKDGTYNSIIGMPVPYFGNIEVLQAEERVEPYRVEYNQDFLAEKAGLPVPETIDSPKKIKKPVMVKASMFSKDRDFERNFIVVKNPQEYKAALKEAVSKAPYGKKKFVRKAFLSAPIQEFIPGGLINLNFFYSPTWEDLEFLGTDTRTQFPNGEEYTHEMASLRESLYNQAVEMAEALIDTVKRYYPPKGICGPFAIQCMGDREERLRPVDQCYRIAGSPDIRYSPPSIYTHRKPMSYGERSALELKDAKDQGTLYEVLS